MADAVIKFEGDITPLEKALDKMDKKIKSIGQGANPKGLKDIETEADKANKSIEKVSNATRQVMSQFTGGGLGPAINGFGALGLAAGIASSAIALTITALKRMTEIKFDILQGNLSAMARQAGLLQERLKFETQLKIATTGVDSSAIQLESVTEQLEAAKISANELRDKFTGITEENKKLLIPGGGLIQLWKKATGELSGANAKLAEATQKAGDEYIAQLTVVTALEQQKALLEAIMQREKEKANLALQDALRADELADAEERLNKALEEEAKKLKDIQDAKNIKNAQAPKNAIADAAKDAADSGVFARGGDKAWQANRVFSKANEIASKGGEAVSKWLEQKDKAMKDGVKLSARDTEVYKLLKGKAGETQAGSPEAAQREVKNVLERQAEAARAQRAEQLKQLKKIADSFEGGLQ